MEISTRVDGMGVNDFSQLKKPLNFCLHNTIHDRGSMPRPWVVQSFHCR